MTTTSTIVQIELQPDVGDDAALSQLTREDAVASDNGSIYLVSKGKSYALILHIVLGNAICSVTTGLITIGIATIGRDLHISPSLAYWPVLVYSLTTGSLLLAAGSVAAIIGSRVVNLTGLLFLAIFTLCVGLARNDGELVAFRALGGVADALFIPTSVSIISNSVPSGKARNVGFSMIGLAQVVGYGVGLVMGGVFVSTVGWRVGYYICGAVFFVLFATGFWILPPDPRSSSYDAPIMTRLRLELDWLGIVLASSGLGLLAYVLGQISAKTSSVKQPVNISLMVLAVIMLGICPFWWRRQQRLDRPALIPLQLWKSLPFSSMCIMIALGYAQMQTMELLTSLYFQNVKGLPAIQTSLRLLPSLVVGAILNFTTGIMVDRTPAVWLVVVSSSLSAGAPLLMALIHRDWSYWTAAFIAQLLYPLCIDILFTVGLVLISELFPRRDQALAGALFNTLGQFGMSFGLAIIAVISNVVSEADGKGDQTSPKALLPGYRAGYWAAFAWIIGVSVVGAFGLRKVGKVGLKRD